MREPAWSAGVVDLHRLFKARAVSSWGNARGESPSRALLFIFLGAACGFVIGGVAGRLTLKAVSGMEQELRRTPAAARGESWGS